MSQRFDSGRARRTSALGALAMALVLALGLAAPALAEKPGEATKVPEVSAPVAGAGLHVVIDPATGELRPPTAEEAREFPDMTRIAQPATESVVITTWPDGTQAADIPESLMSVSVAWINPDGSLSQTCVEGAEAAAALLESVTSTTSVLQEK